VRGRPHTAEVECFCAQPGVGAACVLAPVEKGTVGWVRSSTQNQGLTDIYLSIYAYLSICISIYNYRSISMSISISTHLYIYLHIYISIYRVNPRACTGRGLIG